MTKMFIWVGLFVGSTIGGLIPMIWGDDMFSAAGIIGSFIGAFAGIFAGWKLAQ